MEARLWLLAADKEVAKWHARWRNPELKSRLGASQPSVAERADDAIFGEGEKFYFAYAKIRLLTRTRKTWRENRTNQMRMVLLSGLCIYIGLGIYVTFSPRLRFSQDAEIFRG